MSAQNASETNRTFNSAELAERAIYRRAVEAVIWGMPAVNYDRMLQAAIVNGAKANQVVYWSRPVNWKDQTLTPNPDTIYLNPFYDTTGGPVVMEIPPAEGDAVIVGSADDAWQNALEDVGPAGVDQGRGGKFLITPPGYTEKTPDGYVVLPSRTANGSRSTRWARARIPRCTWTSTTSGSTQRFRTMPRFSNCSTASC